MVNINQKLVYPTETHSLLDYLYLLNGIFQSKIKSNGDKAFPYFKTVSMEN